MQLRQVHNGCVSLAEQLDSARAQIVELRFTTSQRYSRSRYSERLELSVSDKDHDIALKPDLRGLLDAARLTSERLLTAHGAALSLYAKLHFPTASLQVQVWF